MVSTKDDIVDKLRAPYGRLTRAMREDAACEIERSRVRLAELEAALKPFAVLITLGAAETDQWTFRSADICAARAAYLGEK